MADNSTMTGAERLAKKIKGYWSDKGFVVETRVDCFGVSRNMFSTVRSDMINGVPKQ
jgi:hypothetical protein